MAGCWDTTGEKRHCMSLSYFRTSHLGHATSQCAAEANSPRTMLDRLKDYGSKLSTWALGCLSFLTMNGGCLVDHYNGGGCYWHGHGTLLRQGSDPCHGVILSFLENNPRVSCDPVIP
ncbi:hypothetical protein ACFX1Q_014139 [Malus domestica]